jgi:hypothetical protein
MADCRFWDIETEECKRTIQAYAGDDCVHDIGFVASLLIEIQLLISIGLQNERKVSRDAEL